MPRASYLKKSDYTAALFKGQEIGVSAPENGNQIAAVSPCKVHNGVTPDCASTASSASCAEEAVWFLMRAAYGQESKAKDFLSAKGMEVFLPQQERCFMVKGKRVHKMQSLIPNFLFVKGVEAELKQYVGKKPLDFLHHYYVPHKDEEGKAIGKKGIKPLVIPEKQMDYFIKWNQVRDDYKLFVSDDKIPLSQNEKVRVIEGKFAGLEGHVFRIKGQARVGIVINGVGTVFTAYIPKAYLQKC